MNFYQKNQKIIWALILLILSWPGQTILQVPFFSGFFPIIALMLLNEAKKEGGNKKIISIGNIIAGVFIAIALIMCIGLLFSYLSGDKMYFLL